MVTSQFRLARFAVAAVVLAALTGIPRKPDPAPRDGRAAVAAARPQSSTVRTTIAGSVAPAPSDRLRRTLRAKFAAQAPLAELAGILERLAAIDPDGFADVGRDAALAGYGRLSDLLQVEVEALLHAGQEGEALAVVESWSVGPFHESLTNAVFEEVSARLARDSLPDALDWLTALPVSEGRNYALGTIATTWAADSPAAAMDWAMGLSADSRADAMQRVFNRWSNQDSVIAAEWLSAHASDTAADTLIAELVGDSPLLQSNPRLAATWVESISDPELRRRYLSTVILSWGQRDPSAASNYLAADSDLARDQKDQLVQALHSGFGVQN